MTDKFKTHADGGATLSMWAYDSLLVETRRQAAFDQFDIDSPLCNTQAFHSFYALCTSVNEITFGDELTAWAAAFKAWWETAAPLVKNMRFAEAWEQFGEIDGEHHKTIREFMLIGWHQTRRDYIPASEVITAAAAKSEDADFLAVEAPTSKRSKKNT